MTTGTTVLILSAAALGGVGSYLVLPRRHGRAVPRTWHLLGGTLGAVAAASLALLWTPPDTALGSLFFYAFALLAVVGAGMMVLGRNPVYSALTFAAVILSTAGLFLLAGAQFLAAGTVIVYAGAIIVTFLFVIMLAQSEGNALYDRLARAPARSSLVAFALLGGLLYAVMAAKAPTAPGARATSEGVSTWLERADDLPGRLRDAGETGPARVLELAIPATSRMSADLDPNRAEAAANGIPPAHVAGLGGTLFTDHLISVEVAGAILFVALVGAAAIATPKPPVRPTPARPAGAEDLAKAV